MGGFARDEKEVSSFDLEVAVTCRKDEIDPTAIGRKLAEKVVASLGGATTVPSFKGT